MKFQLASRRPAQRKRREKPAAPARQLSPIVTLPLGSSTYTGRTQVDPKGYVTIYLPGHPLARRNGRVPYHRAVCWHALGEPETSPCHWCGYELPWLSDAPQRGRYVVNVDHLNAVPGDDRPENLVPSCFWCNGNRSWAPQTAPQWWDELRRRYGGVHPAERPNMAAVVSRATGRDVNELRNRPVA